MLGVHRPSKLPVFGALLLNMSPNWVTILVSPTLASMAKRPQGTCSRALVTSKERDGMSRPL